MKLGSVGRIRFRWLFPAFSAISLLLSSLTLTGWFQEDDFVLLQAVRSGGPFGMWTHAPSQFFRPLVSLSMWGEYRLFGLDPLPYRVFNCLIHASCAALVSLLVAALSSTRPSLGVAFAAGLLFLVSPVHTEAVSWISARTDLLATLFGLWSLLVLVRTLGVDRPFGANTAHLDPYPLPSEERAAVGEGRVRGKTKSSLPYVTSETSYPSTSWSLVTLQSSFSLVSAVLLFALGLLCKESIIVLPLIAIAYACLLGDRKVAVKVGIAYFTVVGVYLAARVAMIGSDFSGGLDRNLGFKTIGATLVAIVRCVLPGSPIGDPNLNNSEAVSNPVGIAYIALGLAAVVGIFVATRKALDKKLNRFLWVSFFIAMLPALGLSVRLFRTQGERFVYFPSAFILILAAVALATTSGLKPKAESWRSMLLRIVVSLLSGVFVLQQLIWREGANQSLRVQNSFVHDILGLLPEGTNQVVLVNAPTGVQGSYGVIYSLDALGPLFASRPMHVKVISALAPRTDDYSVNSSVSGGVFQLRSSTNAVFNREATATAQGLDPAKTADFGFPKFESHEVWIELDQLPKGIPAYFWDGRSFKPVSAGIIRDK